MGMKNPDTPDSRYKAQPVNYSLFPWEKAGSTGKPITINEDEGFSETIGPPAAQQPPAMEYGLALRSIENFQNSRQLFD